MLLLHSHVFNFTELKGTVDFGNGKILPVSLVIFNFIFALFTFCSNYIDGLLLSVLYFLNFARNLPL